MLAGNVGVSLLAPLLILSVATVILWALWEWRD